MVFSDIKVVIQCSVPLTLSVAGFTSSSVFTLPVLYYINIEHLVLTTKS